MTDRGEPAALDLHEGIALKAGVEGCRRWPKHLRLASSTGKLVPGRCRATNLCRYCQSLYVIETVEALTLDALTGGAPTLWLVLTAREHLTRPQLNEHLRMIRQRLKRAGWSCEWFVQVEFQRRGALHANLLVKGVRAEDAEPFAAAVIETWCARVDAEPIAQWSGVVADALAVTRYTSKMLAHGLKYEQAPPLGWKGHRTSHTRGYFGRPMWQVRRDARESLRFKRELWRAEAEHPALEARTLAELSHYLGRREEWELVALSVDSASGEVVRVRPLNGGGVTTAMRSQRRKEERSAAMRREMDAGRALREARLLLSPEPRTM